MAISTTNFAQIPTDLICRFGELTKSEIRVICYLYTCRNRHTGQCNPRQQNIAEAIRMGKAHVSKAIKSLTEKGWISQDDLGNFVLPAASEPSFQRANFTPRNLNPGVAESATLQGERVTDSDQRVAKSATESSQIGNSHNKEYEQMNEQMFEHTTAADRDRFVKKVIAGIKAEMGLNILPLGAEEKWSIEAESAFINNFTAQEFVGCFAEVNGKNRSYPIQPHYISERLPSYVKRTTTRVSDTLPSIQEKIAEDEANRVAMMTPCRVSRVASAGA